MNSLPLYGFLNHYTGWAIAAAVIIVLVIGYTGLPVWTLVALIFLYGFGAPLWLLIVEAVIALLFNIKPIRTNIITRPIMSLLKSIGFLPTISETEKIALDAAYTIN